MPSGTVGSRLSTQARGRHLPAPGRSPTPVQRVRPQALVRREGRAPPVVGGGHQEENVARPAGRTRLTTSPSGATRSTRAPRVAGARTGRRADGRTAPAAGHHPQRRAGRGSTGQPQRRGGPVLGHLRADGDRCEPLRPVHHRLPSSSVDPSCNDASPLPPGPATGHRHRRAPPRVSTSWPSARRRSPTRPSSSRFAKTPPGGRRCRAPRRASAPARAVVAAASPAWKDQASRPGATPSAWAAARARSGSGRDRWPGTSDHRQRSGVVSSPYSSCQRRASASSSIAACAS